MCIVKVKQLNIYTDDSHNLSKDATKGHASTSVYQSTTGIRNN